jgi:hypothetical protein
MLTTSSVHSSINDQLSIPPSAIGRQVIEHSSATGALSAAERMKVLRFAASFLWADLEVVDSERTFLRELARELDVENATLEVASLLVVPPIPEEIDPNDIDKPEMANAIRQAALRAIASDGVVDENEMKLFELLDELLPKPVKN